MAKIEQKTQTFIANPELSLRIRNLRPIAFELQDSKDHFRYLTFWATTPVFFFFPTSEKRLSQTSSRALAALAARLEV